PAEAELRLRAAPPAVAAQPQRDGHDRTTAPPCGHCGRQAHPLRDQGWRAQPPCDAMATAAADAAVASPKGSLSEFTEAGFYTLGGAENESHVGSSAPPPGPGSPGVAESEKKVGVTMIPEVPLPPCWPTHAEASWRRAPTTGWGTPVTLHTLKY
ncbi:unnamed protein product, partial [Prorocentrum cordatum]